MSDELPVIGVLNLQGAVREHLAALDRLGLPNRAVRMAEELNEVDGLIIPGGESTTIGKLLDRRGLGERIKQRAREGMAVFGTCAGLILLAQRIELSDQSSLALMDVGVKRNAFGRQIESFEAEVSIPRLGEEPVPAVFIRAPIVTDVGAGVEVMAEYEGRIIAVRQGNLLGASFHPELTDDTRMHRFFARMAASARG
ncbi:MAG: pyridoxal 5'-phosphate synthase glutaminase subunit PdxT [Armatimonadetes bacterium]|nr:pyridoxal 5'-phosphate synthase glutaminase subunit PdxT [Armatimonadota bacterium]